jgi:hypothetical protein
MKHLVRLIVRWLLPLWWLDLDRPGGLPRADLGKDKSQSAAVDYLGQKYFRILIAGMVIPVTAS